MDQVPLSSVRPNPANLRAGSNVGDCERNEVLDRLAKLENMASELAGMLPGQRMAVLAADIRKEVRSIRALFESV